LLALLGQGLRNIKDLPKGKTTAALCLARDLFGDDFEGNILELNASDTRGIDVIRTTVKNFARTMGLGDVPFKILVLDEADNMTSDAQQALRRTMEKYTRTCRFILIGNYSSKIIEPIQSRCSIFRFPPLSQEDVKRQLKNIAKKEGANLSEEGIYAILDSSGGDMRKSINILQGAAAFGDEIIAEVVYQVTGRIHPDEIREMIQYALNKNFMEAREQLHNLLIKYGLSGIDILKQMNNEILHFEDDSLKVSLINLLGDAEFRLSEGANEEIQLNSLLANIVLLGESSKAKKL
jgi:replication factor C small subunit